MSGNTWPGGVRHAMSQANHEAWNAAHSPGTRQICVTCGNETGRCEEDSIYHYDGDTETGPLCEGCHTNMEEI